MINVAFTGHRPNAKGMGGYDLSSNRNEEIIKSISMSIMNLMYNENKNERCFNFICGGALGVDQIAFELSNNLKNFTTTDYNITTEIAIPFKKQPNAWLGKVDRDRYNQQCEVADKLTYVDTLDNYKVNGYIEGEYYPLKMQKRNEYMVDNCDILIAVWNGDKKGGTWNCIKYAQQLKKKIIFIMV